MGIFRRLLARLRTWWRQPIAPAASEIPEPPPIPETIAEPDPIPQPAENLAAAPPPEPEPAEPAKPGGPRRRRQAKKAPAEDGDLHVKMPKPARRGQRSGLAPDSEILFEESGAFRLKEAILDQLDGYFRHLKRFKKVDYYAYLLYGRVGAVLSPGYQETEALEPWVLKTLPTFGAIANRVTPELWKLPKYEKMIPARFMFFQKMSQPPSEIERTNHTVYIVSAYHDDEAKMAEWFPGIGHGPVCSWAVAIDPTGKCSLLRIRLSRSQVIRHRHGPYRGDTSTIHHEHWGIPGELKGWAAAHDCPVTELLIGHFIHTANAWAATSMDMIRVTAKKDGIVAAFSVDPHFVSGFFADRDIQVIDGKGVRRRIFHMVRGHIRADGSSVHMHFRGLRRFTWHGYEIHISVPGWHHQQLGEWNVGMHDSEYYTQEEIRQQISMPQLGRMFGAVMDERVSLKEALRRWGQRRLH